MKFDIFITPFHVCPDAWCSECEGTGNHPVGQAEAETEEEVTKMLNLHGSPDGGYVIFGLHKSPKVYIASPPKPPPAVADRQGLLRVLQETGFLGKNKNRKKVTE